MTRLENDAFLESLPLLFKKHRTNGSVVLTMKRYDGKTKPTPKNKEAASTSPAEYLCLLRAYSSGNQKGKISTVVNQKDVAKFQMAYCSLLRANIDGLKKSKKNKKTKA